MEITESCLDAETLAAWVDGGLTAPELERAQTHVAGCVRCQTMVGTLARITAAAPAAKAEAAPRRWLGWLVPLTAAAAAITIWVAIPGSQLDTRLPPPPAAPAPAPPTAQTSVQAPTPAPAPTFASADTPAPTPAPATAGRHCSSRTLTGDADGSRRAAAIALDKIAQPAEPVTMTGQAPAAVAQPPPPPMAPAPRGFGGGVAAGGGGRWRWRGSDASAGWCRVRGRNERVGIRALGGAPGSGVAGRSRSCLPIR